MKNKGNSWRKKVNFWGKGKFTLFVKHKKKTLRGNPSTVTGSTPAAVILFIIIASLALITPTQGGGSPADTATIHACAAPVRSGGSDYQRGFYVDSMHAP